MNLPTLMNSPLASGAIAFCIPLILHILNRSRFKQVEWGAMHLLESVVKVNHKRFRWEQLLLLLVRCSIPALLAFTLAKPVLTGAKAPAGDSPVSLVILLDNSYSMDAGDGTSTRFDEARAAACAVVEAAPRGSEIAVIQTGGTPTPLFDRPIFDSDAVIRRLRSMQADYGASDMQQSLDAGITTLAGMTHARRELFVISDFQSADWQQQTAGKVFQQQVDAMNIKPAVTLLQLGKDAFGNVSIDSLDFSSRPLGIGQQLSVRVNVRNHGDSESKSGRLVLKVDGKEQAVSQITLAANSTAQALFPCEFDTPGSHVFEVDMLVDDALKADNRLAAAVTIWDQIDVLLVDGDPSSEPLKSETAFLSVALTPYTFGRMKLSELVRTKTVTQKANLKAEFAKKPKVVVLANVSKLSEAQANELGNYVQAGGAVLVCAGSKTDRQWYNKALYQQRGLLPAAFGLPKGVIDSSGKSTRIVTQRFDHPALQFFNEPANGDLSAAEIRQWFELQLPATLNAPQSSSQGTQNGSNSVMTEGDSGAAMLLTSMLVDSADESATAISTPIVMARFDNGDAFLVEKSLGDGVVIQMATSVDADWSDLPLRPFYVPMMQQIVTTMATQLSPPRNIRTGETAVAFFPTESNITDDQPMRLSMTTPDGSQRSVVSSAQGRMQVTRFADTTRPGIYSLSTPEQQTLHFVATTPREESNLSMLDQDQLQALSQRMGAQVVESSTQYLKQDRLRRDGREIWRFVLAAFLAFLFLELLLQQRFSRVRT